MNTTTQETEVKLRIEGSVLEVKQKLATFCKYSTPTEEENRIYDTAEGKLKDRKQVLRIRYAKHPVGDLDPKIELTFKDKGTRSKGISSRPEYNVNIQRNELANLTKVLEGLGYRPSFVYEKKRETWKFPDVKVTVEIDELPYIGHFLEIEGPDSDVIEQVIDQLGVRHFERCSGSYIKLLRDEMKRRKVKGIEARFNTSA